MRKLIFAILVFVCFAVLSSCSPSRMFMVGTQGTATYNRNTGQFEMIWEYNEKQPSVIHDTVYVDSCRVR